MAADPLAILKLNGIRISSDQSALSRRLIVEHIGQRHAFVTLLESFLDSPRVDDMVS